MTTLKLKYIHRFRDRHGKLRHYFRRRGEKRIPLSGLPGSAEFMEAYQAALSGAPERVGIGKPPKARSVRAAAIGYMTSIDFLSLSPGTQANRRRALDSLCRAHADKPIALINRQHIKALMAERIVTPAAANFLRQTFHWLMQYALDSGWRTDGPTISIKKIEYETDGFHTWTEKEVEKFKAHWPVGSNQRLVFDLLLETGQRSGDVRTMVWSQVNDNTITVRQLKGKGKVTVFIPITKALRQTLETADHRQDVVVLTSFHKPFTEKGFSNYVSKAARLAGLSDCTAHGLRKVAATRLAEAGCTPHEIMAITGHTTMDMVLLYTRAAEKAGLAIQAAAKLRSANDAAENVKETA